MKLGLHHQPFHHRSQWIPLFGCDEPRDPLAITSPVTKVFLQCIAQPLRRGTPVAQGSQLDEALPAAG